MVEFINALTGTRMFVTESRIEEYLAAGHRQVDDKNDTGNPSDISPNQSMVAENRRNTSKK